MKFELPIRPPTLRSSISAYLGFRLRMFEVSDSSSRFFNEVNFSGKTFLFEGIHSTLGLDKSVVVEDVPKVLRSFFRMLMNL